MRYRIPQLLAALAVTLASVIGADSVPDAVAVDAAFVTLSRLQYGDDPERLQPIQEAVAAARLDEKYRSALEFRLIDVLTEDTPDAAKDYACRTLVLVGSSDAVPALAALLPNPDLSHLARCALEEIPGTAVDKALRRALGDVEGRLKIGVIASLGYRRDPRAVALLAALAREPDVPVATAAATSLGQIASPQAALALGQFLSEAPAILKPVVAQASLQAAERLRRDGRARLAADVYRTVQGACRSGYLYLGAFQGLVEAEPAQASARLLVALAGTDVSLRKLAVRLIAESPDRSTPTVMLEALAKLPPHGKIALLDAVGRRRETSARTVVVPLLKAKNDRVRLAAVTALGLVGGPEDVAVLARLAAKAGGEESELARQALVDLPGEAIDASIAEALEGARPWVRVELMNALAARSARSAAEAVALQLDDRDTTICVAAARALEEIGDENQVPALIAYLSTTDSSDQYEAATSALRAICARVGQSAGEGIIRGLEEGDVATRTALLPLLSILGGETALRVARDAASHEDDQVRDVAVRTLTDWPDIGAAPDVLVIARDSENASHRVLAYRGYIRLVRESQAVEAERLNLLARAAVLAKTPEQRRLIVAAVGDLATVRALYFVAKYLADPALADEAGAAAVRIASQLDARQKGEIIPVLDRVLKSAQAKSVLDDAGKLKRKLGA